MNISDNPSFREDVIAEFNVDDSRSSLCSNQGVKFRKSSKENIMIDSESDSDDEDSTPRLAIIKHSVHLYKAKL